MGPASRPARGRPWAINASYAARVAAATTGAPYRSATCARSALRLERRSSLERGLDRGGQRFGLQRRGDLARRSRPARRSPRRHRSASRRRAARSRATPPRPSRTSRTGSRARRGRRDASRWRLAVAIRGGFDRDGVGDAQFTGQPAPSVVVSVGRGPDHPQPEAGSPGTGEREARGAGDPCPCAPPARRPRAVRPDLARRPGRAERRGRDGVRDDADRLRRLGGARSGRRPGAALTATTRRRPSRRPRYAVRAAGSASSRPMSVESCSLTSSGRSRSAATAAAASPSGSPVWAWRTSIGVRVASARANGSNTAACRRGLFHAVELGAARPGPDDRQPHHGHPGTPGARAGQGLGVGDCRGPGRLGGVDRGPGVARRRPVLRRLERRHDDVGPGRREGPDEVGDERAASRLIVGRVPASDDEDRRVHPVIVVSTAPARPSPAAPRPQRPGCYGISRRWP